MINYLIELSVIHVILIGVYLLFLRNETQFEKVRFFILLSTLFSLIIPFLNLPQLFTQPQAVELVSAPLQAIYIDPIVVIGEAESGFNWNLLLYGYFMISTLLFAGFLIKLFRLYQLHKASTVEFFHTTEIKRVKGINGSFSFFNWIFLGDDHASDDEDIHAIIRHEKAHAAMGHTYDLLFLELFKVAFWWLPTAWLAQKEIKKIHEYQADAYAVKSFSIDRYSSILISSTLKSNGLSLASSFHDGLIFKRLNAMKQKAKNVSPWKLGAIALITLTLVVVFACNKETDQALQEMGKDSRAISFDQLPSTMQTRLDDVKNDLTFLRIEMDGNSSDEDFKKSLSEIEELRSLDPSAIHSVDVVKEKDTKAVYIAVRKTGASFNYLADKSKQQGEVFTIVEQLPEYPGGMDALYAHIGQNISYPATARKQGIEGRVMVEFVVETDGSISNVNAVKGIGGGCDEEAVRVVGTAKNFTPGSQRGKKVRTKMMLPIQFTLNKTEVENGGVIVIDELEIDKAKMKVKAGFDSNVWKGTVFDTDGKPMPGVNIVEEGTGNGTVSNLDGTFTLKPANKDNHLVLSYVGFETMKLSNAVVNK